MTIPHKIKDVPVSILDVVSVPQGSTHKQAMENSLSLAQHVEKLGYKRFWISEHHNTASLVSSATPLLIGYIAQGTKTIRVGSGGVMLPNHAPLIVAEQFGTLATLYPDRIDLGLGRAPGTDQVTARALRRQHVETVHDFPRDIQELQHYFSKSSHRSDVPSRAKGLKCRSIFWVPVLLVPNFRASWDCLIRSQAILHQTFCMKPLGCIEMALNRPRS